MRREASKKLWDGNCGRLLPVWMPLMSTRTRGTDAGPRSRGHYVFCTHDAPAPTNSGEMRLGNKRTRCSTSAVIILQEKIDPNSWIDGYLRRLVFTRLRDHWTID